MTAQADSEYGVLAEHDFACSICDASAGKIILNVKGDRSMVFIDSFTGVVRSQIHATKVSRAQTALASGNAQTLFNLDIEFTPFFCPRCQKSYCQDHWRTWDVDDEDGWYDSTRGVCPSGHERILSD